MPRERRILGDDVEDAAHVVDVAQVEEAEVVVGVVGAAGVLHVGVDGREGVVEAVKGETMIFSIFELRIYFSIYDCAMDVNSYGMKIHSFEIAANVNAISGNAILCMLLLRVRVSLDLHIIVRIACVLFCPSENQCHFALMIL